MSVNIPRDSDDPFYRYKRIVLNVTSINKNNGTSVIQLDELTKLSKDLDRDVKQIISYIQHKTHSRISKQSSCYHIRGQFSTKEIDDIIEEYIDMHVICGLCGNPETIEGKKSITCKACGGRTKQLIK